MMKIIRRKFLSKIRNQMISVFFISMLLGAAVMVSICIYYMKEEVKQSAIRSSVQTSSQVSMEVQVMLDEATKILQWGQSTDVYNFLNGKDVRINEAVQLIQDMSMYRTSSLIDSNISAVYIFDEDGMTYDEKLGVYLRERYAKSEYIYRQVLENQGYLIYVDGSSIDENQKDFIMYGSAIHQPATDKVIGFVVVEFKINIFDKYLENAIIGDTGSFCICDSNNQIVAGSNLLYEEMKRDTAFKDDMDEQYCLMKYRGKDILIVHNSIPYTAWYSTCAVGLGELTGDLNVMIRMIALSAVFVTLFTLVVYSVITTRLTRPIWQMKGKMLEAAEGNLNAVITEFSENEFYVLEKQYNKMLQDIKELILHNQEDQEKLQKAEFNALQSQIAPHFLYNTLDTIIWLVAVNENEKAIEMIENLSVFFKTGLSKGMDWISVEREIEHVRSYLYIQQSRYNDILKYSIDIDTELYNYDMLKMTLQPIVENAIYHGIKNKTDGGSIAIHGYLQESGEIIFDIVDTGVGMERKEVDKLNRRMSENKYSFEEKENGFGLYNVNRRIKLYYDDDCGIVIDSNVDEGTHVKIRLKTVKGRMENV